MKTVKTWSGIICVAALSWMAATRASAVTNVYSDTFESYPEGTPLVDGTNYWYADSTNVVVQTNDAAAGSTKSAMLPIDTTLSNRFTIINPTNAWLHLEAKPVRYDGTNDPVADTNAAALFYVNSNGYFVAYDGNVDNWVSITQSVYGAEVSPIPLNTWVTNLNVYIDFSNKTWQITLGADLLKSNIGFANTNISAMSGFSTYNGGSTTSYLDNVYLYDQAPFAGFLVDPTQLTNSCFKDTTAADQTFAIIGGAGVMPLNYTIVTNGGATWLSVNPGSGTISNGETNVINISYASAALDSGSYTSYLNIATADGVGYTQTVAVTLNVIDWRITPTNVDRAVMQGFEAPSTNVFAILLANTNYPSYVITTNVTAPWLVVTPGTGTLTAGTNTIPVLFTTNGLDVGVHSAMLTVVTTLGGGLTDHVSIAMTTFSQPIPTINSNSFMQTVPKGVQPTNASVIIHNIGDVPRSGMRYDVVSTSAWLSANGGVCTNGEDHTISIQFANMRTNVGTYNGTLTIHTVDTNAPTWYTPIGQVSTTVLVGVQVLIIGPGTPGNLAASAGTDTSGIQLNWSATTNVNHYEVWRANTNILASATMIASNVTVTNYSDTTIDPGVYKWYWVRAINDTGGDGDFCVPNYGWRFLPAPTSLAATSGAYTNRVALSWTGSSGAVNYEIWRSIYNNVSLATLLGTVSAAATTYDDTTGIATVTYYYWVRAVTADRGNYSDAASGYRAALLKPTGVSASKGTFNYKVRVLWQAVTAAASYEIWRSADSSVANAVRIGTETILGYDDTTASAGKIYYYWIRALDSQGYASPYSDSDSGSLQLATPANVSATQGTRPYSVRISWSAVENATSYEVVRSSGSGLNAEAQKLAESTPLADIAPSLIYGTISLKDVTQTFYDDNATFAGASYLYAVRAKNAQGSSELSGAATGWREVRQSTTSKKVTDDYDGDKLADVVLYNSGSGLLRILCTTLGELPIAFGDATCVPVQGDYDGDGKADPMVYSATQGYWLLSMSSLDYVTARVTFGGTGQLAAAADYDGDHLPDPATYEAATGTLRVLLSQSGYALAQAPLGGPGYVDAVADYDGDNKADPAIYSATAGLLSVKLSNSGYSEGVVPFGGVGSIIVPGDLDGDNKSELTIYNESLGMMAIKLSSLEYLEVVIWIGGPGYAWAVAADYDGDGLMDPAVYSQTSGWQIAFSSLDYATQSDTFGGTSNVPFVP